MKSALIVRVRCPDYASFAVLIGAIGETKNEGIEILSHEREDNHQPAAAVRKPPSKTISADRLKWLNSYAPQTRNAMKTNEIYNVIEKGLSAKLKIPQLAHPSLVLSDASLKTLLGWMAKEKFIEKVGVGKYKRIS